LQIIKNHGVTRVSINTQTLNNDVLELVGRKHSAADFYRAFEMARSVDIPVINTDLIAGLPGEGFGSFSETIDALIKLRPENLTFHTLCIKNAADFAHKKSNINAWHTFNETSKCVDYSQLSAKNAGYIPYYIYRQKNTIDNLENVGYALPGTEGLYNIYMMEEIHSIFAVGAGAVSKMVSRDGTMIDRIFEYKYPYEYLAETNGLRNEEKIKKIVDFYHNIW
jgi:oxygen-independent coproporphyrinogen-3 oxidase